MGKLGTQGYRLILCPFGLRLQSALKFKTKTWISCHSFNQELFLSIYLGPNSVLRIQRKIQPSSSSSPQIASVTELI